MALYVDSEALFGFAVTPGVDLPKFNRDGVRSVDADFACVPSECSPPQEPDSRARAFVHDRLVEQGADFGPVTGAWVLEPTEAGLAEIRAGVVEIMSGRATSVRLELVAEYCIRHERWRPDVLVTELLGEMDRLFIKRHPPYFVPSAMGQAARAVHRSGFGALDAAATSGVVARQTYEPDELPSCASLGNISALAAACATRGLYVPAVAEPAPSHQSPEKSEKKRAK